MVFFVNNFFVKIDVNCQNNAFYIAHFIACYLTYFLTCSISTFSPMIERKFPSWRNSGRHTKRIIGKIAFFGKLQLDTTDEHLVFHSVTRIDAGLKTIAKDLLLPLLNVRLSISKVNGSNFCSKTHIFTIFFTTILVPSKTSQITRTSVFPHFQPKKTSFCKFPAQKTIFKLILIIEK